VVTKRALLLALFLVALGGFFLHFRIHPFMVQDKVNPVLFHFSGTNFLAFLFPLTDVVIVTILFAFRRTAVYGFLLNGLIVIYGTVFMTHFSIAQLIGQHLPLQAGLLKSLLPDVAILWADFFLGKALYDLHLKG
jgi:hypothetical protein